MSLSPTWVRQVMDPVRYQAFAALLARPDPADLPRRAHRVTQESDPVQRATDALWHGLLIRWSQRFKLERGEELPGRARRMPKPRIWTLARDGRL